MQEIPEQPTVTKYQFEIDDDKWSRWKDTVPRSKSLDERIRELIEADTYGRVVEPGGRPNDSEGDTPATPDGEHTAPVSAERDAAVGAVPGEIDEAVQEAVDGAAEDWDEDDRLENRRKAAEAVLQHAVNTGDEIGKSHPIVDEVIHNYPVNGQNRETYWRHNIRDVLQDVGEYSRGRRSYKVEL